MKHTFLIFFCMLTVSTLFSAQNQKQRVRRFSSPKFTHLSLAPLDTQNYIFIQLAQIAMLINNEKTRPSTPVSQQESKSAS